MNLFQSITSALDISLAKDPTAGEHCTYTCYMGEYWQYLGSNLLKISCLCWWAVHMYATWVNSGCIIARLKSCFGTAKDFISLQVNCGHGYTCMLHRWAHVCYMGEQWLYNCQAEILFWNCQRLHFSTGELWTHIHMHATQVNTGSIKAEILCFGNA